MGGGPDDPRRGAVGGALRGAGGTSRVHAREAASRTGCCAGSRSTTSARSPTRSTPTCSPSASHGASPPTSGSTSSPTTPTALGAILAGDRPVQILIAGKAHPSDEGGKETLQDLFRLKRERGLAQRIVFVEDYDLDVARRLVAGCDVWVNLPRRPMEASGTSGMKATFNGALAAQRPRRLVGRGVRRTQRLGDPRATRTATTPSRTHATRRASTSCSRARSSRCSTTATATASHVLVRAGQARPGDMRAAFHATRMVNDYVERIYPQF